MNYTRIILHVSSSLNSALICNLLNSLLHLLINIWLILLSHLCSLLFKMFLLSEVLFQIESDPMTEIQLPQPRLKPSVQGKHKQAPKEPPNARNTSQRMEATEEGSWRQAATAQWKWGGISKFTDSSNRIKSDSSECLILKGIFN